MRPTTFNTARSTCLLAATLLGGSGIPRAQQAKLVPAAEPAAPLVSASLPVIYKELLLPTAPADRAGLAAMLVVPKLPGRHPLVLLAPGSNLPGKDPARELREVGPGRLLPEAIWFARRGWVVAIVLQRGMGKSGGMLADDMLHILPYTPGTIARAEQTNATDLRAALAQLARRPEIDPSHVIAVGNFDGGTAAMWLAAPPPSPEAATSTPLSAVINFSGGWVTVPDFKLQGKVHGIPDVVEPAFRSLGAATRVPMLWLYPDAGSEFGLRSAVAARLAFTAAGGLAEMHVLPHTVDRETSLFDLDAAVWGPLVERFLSGLGLPATPLLPEATLPLASELPEEFQIDKRRTDTSKGYLQYLRRGPCKAFARSPHGDWAYATGKATVALAEQAALKACGRGDCVVEESLP